MLSIRLVLVNQLQEGRWSCRRVEVKKAWAVHLAQQQQTQQQGSEAEEEQEEEQDSEAKAADAAEVHFACAATLPFMLPGSGAMTNLSQPLQFDSHILLLAYTLKNTSICLHSKHIKAFNVAYTVMSQNVDNFGNCCVAMQAA